MDRNFVVAITGASGAPYAKRLIETLVAAEEIVHLIVSPHGRQLLADEMNIRDISADTFLGHPSERIILHAYNDLSSKLASGSFLTSAMVICPASANTLGAVAAGLGDNLITRAAQVTLKEARRLILVPREMPLSPIDLQNMLRLSRAGAIICPPMPGFYLRPKTLEDIIDFVVGKVLDLLNVEHGLDVRWESRPPGGKSN